MRRRLPAAFIVDLAREVLGRGGVLGFVARGHSMGPFLDDGARVILGAGNPDNLRPGQIVLALTPHGPRLHRVRALREVNGELQLLLRGDSEQHAGEWIDANQVVGILVAARRARSAWRSTLKRGLSALFRSAA